MKKYSKKIISFVLVVMMSITMFVPAFANGEISVYLDNEKIQFDVAPILVNGRTMVPMRAIFEKLGAVVFWDNDTRTAIAQKGNVNVSISIDDTTLYKNGESIVLDVPAQLNGGRTLVPLRAVSEAFECDVQWNGDTQTVNISTINSLTSTQISISELRNWIDDNYNYSFVSGAEYKGYEIKKGSARFTVSPGLNSTDVVVSYSNMTLKENTNFSLYLSDSRFIGGYYLDKTRSASGGNIVKSTSSNEFDMVYNSYESDYSGNKNVILDKFNKAAEDTLILFENFLKEKNIGLSLKDFELDYNLPEKSIQQDIAFDNLKAFVLLNQNDVINDKPVYAQLYDDSSGSVQYSIQYNDKNDTIKLTIRKIYNGAWIYSHTTLTREEQTYHCSFSFYNPSNNSNTPDFDATYTIDARSFGENSNINFSNISGNKANVSSYKELAKLMNLEMLNYTDFIFNKILESFECSMADFGFNLK